MPVTFRRKATERLVLELFGQCETDEDTHELLVVLQSYLSLDHPRKIDLLEWLGEALEAKAANRRAE